MIVLLMEMLVVCCFVICFLSRKSQNLSETQVFPLYIHTQAVKATLHKLNSPLLTFREMTMTMSLSMRKLI